MTIVHDRIDAYMIFSDSLSARYLPAKVPGFTIIGIPDGGPERADLISRMKTKMFRSIYRHDAPDDWAKAYPLTALDLEEKARAAITALIGDD